MKKYGWFFVFGMALVSFNSCTGTYAVRERPSEVEYVRPAAPSRDHIWISGDWVWASGRYDWREGRWDRPRAGNKWRDGYWQNSKRGSKWNPGRWERN